MHRKGAQDAKRAKVFTKITREIITAVKSGMPDPASNPRLRAAIQMARLENMSNEKVQAAIKRGSGANDTENYDEIRYEGYGPGGVAVIVEALTDNRNRTASEVRSSFTKYGGNLGETGSVAFMFDKVGALTYPAKAASEDAMLEAAIDAGADNCESSEAGHTITCAPENFGEVRDALEKTFGQPESAKIIWQPKNTTPVDEEQAKQLLKMIEVLEDSDDVQQVYCNFDISADILEKLSA